MSEHSSNSDWRNQLQQTVSGHQQTVATRTQGASVRAQVAQIIKDNVLPAVQDFSLEMEKLGRDCQVFHSGNTVSIEVRSQRHREFIYGIKVESKERAPLSSISAKIMRMLPGDKARKAAYKAGGGEKQYHPMTRLSVRQAANWSKQDFIDVLVKKYQEALQQNKSDSV